MFSCLWYYKEIASLVLQARLTGLERARMRLPLELRREELGGAALLPGLGDGLRLYYSHDRA